MIFPGPSLRHKNKSEMTGDCYFFKYVRLTEDGTEIFDAFSEWNLRLQIYLA